VRNPERPANIPESSIMTAPAIPDKKRILIVEDHPLFRAMLVQLIDKELGMAVCGEAANIKDAMAIMRQTQPDAALVDITLEGSSGLELIKDMKAQELQIPVLVISMHEDRLYAERVLRAGARGYISKHAPPSEVLVAIRKVLGGGIYLSELITRTVLERVARGEKAGESDGMDLLSDRELEVFQLVGRGLNSRQISEQINLGVTTVDSYRQRIKEKLGLKNAAALYQRAARWVVEGSL
jgi:DNA-binding NarL/FixJ family response regulator